MSILRYALAAFLMFTVMPFSSLPAQAGEAVTYKDDALTLEGYVAPAEGVDNAPIVMIVHQWKGLGAYEKMRADMLAKLGYTAFAIDMYGQGVRPQTDDAAAAESAKYKSNPKLARQRLLAALAYAKTLKGADPSRIAVIGYCFGGGMALELARTGADIKAAISFHGVLATRDPVTTPGVIKAAIQIHHGADDPYVSPLEVQGFIREMNAAQADWTLTEYGHAVHGFTEKDYGTDNSKGVAYNARADARSWSAALDFLKAALARG